MLALKVYIMCAHTTAVHQGHVHSENLQQRHSSGQLQLGLLALLNIRFDRSYGVVQFILNGYKNNLQT